jgi:hypothetical protein
MLGSRKDLGINDILASGTSAQASFACIRTKNLDQVLGGIAKVGRVDTVVIHSHLCERLHGQSGDSRRF